MEQQAFVQNIEHDDRTVAWQILCALCESSLADEFDHYFQDVQADLKISDEQMQRVYNLNAICRLLAPEAPRPRLYKGQRARGRFAEAIFSVMHRGPSLPPLEFPERVWTPICSGGICTLPLRTAPLPPVDENECENEEKHDDAPPAEQDNDSGSSSSDKNKHPAAKAMRKLLRTVGIPLEGLTLDTDKYEKALVIFGNTKPHKEQLSELGGKWNARLVGWVFSKQKLVTAMSTAESRRTAVAEEQVDELFAAEDA
jgi:hypothetical protein